MEITTIIVTKSRSRQQMVTTMSKMIHVSRKTLHKHSKFRVQVDENDEIACWALITRKTYQDKIATIIKPIVVEF